MLGLGRERHRTAPSELILSSLVSCLFVFLSQFALAMASRYFASTSLLATLAISALFLLAVSGFGRCCRRLLRVYASATAFVFFNILYIWGVYLAVIRKATTPLTDLLFNAEICLLIIGLYRIISSDPGFVARGHLCLDKLCEIPVCEVKTHNKDIESTTGVCHEHPVDESSFSVGRVRYCRSCKAYVKGFDHHCPAFGNCIGEKNHILFMLLLVGFIISEASYIVFVSQFVTKFQMMDETQWEISVSCDLSISTMMFCLLQVLWQVVFLVWHIYCICLNIKTDEWIDWKKYPEFHLVLEPQLGQTYPEIRFKNPYDKGIFGNIKEFLASGR